MCFTRSFDDCDEAFDSNKDCVRVKVNDRRAKSMFTMLSTMISCSYDAFCGRFISLSIIPIMLPLQAYPRHI